MKWSLSVKYQYCLSAFQCMAFVIACFEITDVYYVNEIGTDFKHHIQAYHDVNC